MKSKNIRNILVALAIATGAGRADTVSVNLGAGQAKVTDPLGAGVVNDTTWENISDGAAGAASNVDSSTVDVSWVAHNVWRTNANTATGGGQLMKGRWDSNGLTGDVIAISDINATYATYDVIVYYAFNQGNTFDLTVGGQTVFVNQGGQNAAAGTNQLGLDNYLSNGPSDGVNPSHWHRFNGLTADSITINVSNLTGRAGFTGFQLVKAPDLETAPVKMIADSPQTFDNFGGNETFAIHFSNTGIDEGQTLNISSVTLGGPDAGLFTAPVTWTTGVAANGGSGTIDLPFSPGANPVEGSRHVTLTVNSNSEDSPTVIDVEVDVRSGVVLEAEIAQTFTTKGVPGVFKIGFSNTGTDETKTLDIASVTLSGPDAGFFTAPEAWSTAVAANGGAGTIDLAFDPGSNPSDRSYLVTLNVHSNALNSPTAIDVHVDTLTPYVVVSPAGIDFGDFNSPPAPQSLPLTVRNEGITGLTINDARIFGDGAGVFSVSQGYPITVPAGGSTDLTVTFTPNGSEGPWFEAEIDVETDAANQAIVTVPVKAWVAPAIPQPVVSVNLGASQAKVTDPLGAGVVNDTTWENIVETPAVAGSATNVDNSTIDVSWVAHQIWQTNAATTTGGGQLMKGRWDSAGLTGDVIAISDINATYENYDVIVYYAFNQGNTFDLTVGGRTVFVNQGGQNAAAGPNQLGLDNYLSNGPSDGVNPSHWHRFNGLTADSVTINVSNLTGRAGFTGFQIVQAQAGGNYASWIGTFPNVGTKTGFDEDADGDGISNGVEAFFGTDPSVANGGLSVLSINGAIATFSHPQADPPLGDVTGSYQWSPDLVNWYAGDGVDGPAGGPTVTIPAVAPVGGIATVTATASEPLAKLFVRAIATR